MSSVISLEGYSVAEESSFPSVITYQSETDQKVFGILGFLQGILQTLGRFLRNAFYLPLYNEKIMASAAPIWNIAEEEVTALKKSGTCSIRDITFHCEGSKTKDFKVRLLETTEIGGKTLRIILFSFYGHTETEKGEKPRKWDPLAIRELSGAPLGILKALKENGIRVDSLATVSLGNVVFDGLKHISLKDRDIIPSQLLIKMGLTSVEKSAKQLYSFPIGWLLHQAIKLTRWDANPEQELLNFLQASKTEEPRKIAMVTVRNDFYFSGKGALDADIHEKMSKAGALVFQADFQPFLFHPRAEHALSLDHLVKNCETKIIDTMNFSLETREKLSEAFARNVFFSGDEKRHTCFLVCGNMATLDAGTMLEAAPLVTAFNEVGQKIAAAKVSQEELTA